MAKTNQGNKASDILEDPAVLLDKLKGSEEFFQKNKKMLTYIVGALVLAIGGFLFYKYQSSQTNKEAQAAMFKSVFAWERDSLKTALNGFKGDVGLINIAEDYANTSAGNLANYYVGVAYLKQGEFQKAIDYLKEFNSNDLLLQGMVYSLLGDAYLELKDTENAVQYYSKAADYKPNAAFTPRYLMKLALVHELNKDYDKAIKAYDKIIDGYPLEHAAVNDAKKYKGRAEGLKAKEEAKK